MADVERGSSRAEETQVALAPWLALLLAAYFASRLFALTALPPFIDEAVHIDWARETLQGNLLAGSWGGRWLTIKIMSAFLALPLHPLLAARLSAVVVGAGALIACVLVGRQLYSAREGIAAGVLYLVLPFALFFGRVALAESFAGAFAGAVLFFSIEAARRHRRADVVALSVALVAMFLAKFYTIVLVLLPLAAVVCLQPRRSWTAHLLRIAPAWVPVGIALALMVWRGHGTHYIGEQSAADLGQVALVVTNLPRVAGWFWDLLTPPLAVALALSLLWVLRRNRQRADLLLAAALLILVVPFVVGAQVWFPRYLVPALVPLCVLLARAACATAAARLGLGSVPAGLAAMALLAWPLYVDTRILLRPDEPVLTRTERANFYEGWGAGWGLPELASDLQQRSLESEGGIHVVRFYFWNQANFGLNVYLSPTPKLALHTIDPTDTAAPAALARMAESGPTFFVLNPPNDAQLLAEIGRSVDDYFQGATRVWHYARPASSLEVWQLRPGTDPRLHSAR